MLPWARNPSSLSWTAAGRVWQRSVGVYPPPRGLRSSALDTATGLAHSSLRQMLSRSHPRPSGVRTILISASPSGASAEKVGYVHRGMNQARSFTKINNTKATDSHKTEEVLQRFETKDGEEGTQPQRQVLNEEGKRSQSTLKPDTEPHSMTTGKWPCCI
ncbi:hypothetical protein N7510_003712 [Penicillium lagena]|uniref:uncharacterized protein n=1 Tax=Penicillium lagena TaxID=94218 RepID=UPI00254115AF|nr:uncharacterized protein N7510_003712 [Penicillium lagena]KAJ5619728.1 hypothetical protein N7510_003712 [Penicillium lagena]